MTTPSESPPPEIEARARERAEARASRDYARADGLRAEIETAGWRVVDSGTAYHIEPAAPPTVEAAGVLRYGSAGAVPTVLDGPVTAAFTVVLLADAWPDDLVRALAGLRSYAPPATQVVIVANDPDLAQAARLAEGSRDLEAVAGEPPELVWTSARLGYAAAFDIGLRRALGAVVVLADTSMELVGDALTPLADELADPGVAVAGSHGFVSSDARHFVEAAGPEVDTIDGRWLAFRRIDLATLGPLDERFVSSWGLDAWWSLVLRDGPDPALPPRRAVRLALPLVPHEDRRSSWLPAAERERRAKRNSYRLLDRFRDRRVLLSGPPAG